MNPLNDTFTSTGAKFFAHQEAMNNLRNGKGQPIVTHVMLTDVCNHTCAFCSVQARAGDSLHFDVVVAYLLTLKQYGLKAVILSGGGNPILYKCKVTGKNFNHVVNVIHEMGLEIGLITNGMPLRTWEWTEDSSAEWCRPDHVLTRKSWKSIRPSTLDKLTWIRISMAGLDHDEREVYVPDIDPTKTTLGFSYVAHDIYEAPEDKHHGKVSTGRDLINLRPKYLTQLESGLPRLERRFEDRIAELTEEIRWYVNTYRPAYVRLLPNCLEPPLIPRRCKQLQEMAHEIDPSVVFVQQKPPKAPKACYLGYIHPVLNCDGWVYPCDSCVLNETAGHQFANPWRVCRWDEVTTLYDRPVRSLIDDPARTCPGCVFTQSNELLTGVVEGSTPVVPLSVVPVHANFV